MKWPLVALLSSLLSLWTPSATAQDTFFAKKKSPTAVRVLSSDEIKTLQASFLSASQRPARESAAQSLLGGGEAGVSALLDALDEWLEKKTDAEMRTPDSRHGVSPAEKKRELKRLQTEVQGLRSIEDLTKERIVEVGDPALLRIAALLKSISASEGEALRGVGPEFEEYRRQAVRALGTATFAQMNTRRASPSRSSSLDSLYERSRARDVKKWNDEQSESIPKDWAGGIEDLNRIRMLAGLRPLKTDVKLCQTAEDHSKDMVTLNFFDHISPVKGKKTFTDRASHFGATASSENIFAGAASPESANEGWFHSPGHHKNMMAPDHEFVGLGRSGDHWTQLFR